MIKTKDLATLNKFLFVYSFSVLIAIFSEDSKERSNFSLKITMAKESKTQ